MTERRKDLLALALLLALLIAFFAQILFTGKIIRAPDIINEYYWSVLRLSSQEFLDFFRIPLHADWDIYANSGNTLEGGEVGGHFLFLPNLIYYFISPPASVAWFIVLHLFFGACGTYCCCRAIGLSRPAAFFGGLIFALAPENASLINAGHVLKIATISVAPWAFFLLERGFQRRRVIWFLATGFALAIQFFYTHWQIAFYTCLCIGVYGIARSIGILVTERPAGRETLRLAGLNLVVLFFFLSTVAVSLVPLASWSVDTNRGAQSGANQGKGGLAREEAMLWSLPPEELGAFVVPGMVGFSRQEGGENPSNIAAYYWGRMVFTQTTSYLGLLPWLLVPLPLIFRRDRYTWLAVGGLVGGILFSMGKYTPFYNLLFDYFPGIDRFRVPKMMMFIPVLGIGVLAARGVDLLRDGALRQSPAFRRYAVGLLTLPVALLVVLGIQYGAREHLVGAFVELLARPTNYQQGAHLVGERWNNLMVETGIAAGLALLCALSVWLWRKGRLSSALLPAVLVVLYVADVGRVNAKFMFLVDAPRKTAEERTTVIDYLARQPKEYRVLPLGADPNPYVLAKIPTFYMPMPVQQVRWQDILDNFAFDSAIPDMLNVRYLVYGREQYEQQKPLLAEKYMPVFISPDGSQVVLENRSVLPKGWLVPSAAVIPDSGQALAILQNRSFDPRRLALVETPPPIPLATPNDVGTGTVGTVRLDRYEGVRIDLAVAAERNALLVLGEKYYRGWKAYVDGKETPVYPVNHILRGIYLPPGEHRVEFRFDPLPFKIGKYLTLASFALFAGILIREWLLRRRSSAV
ncbi:YfhO family protein [Geobacter sp.]|uniref:YfhO family protein n=1 Tax=Geobacter sp. TaxID=46610 RepID=UPI0027B95718|nr:YfhO family protein [Geobacter sp.]